MGRGGKPKHVGSCGLYVIVDEGDDCPRLLVHRRSKQVSERLTIATPGGIVERVCCQRGEGDALNFNAGAKEVAIRELFEEAGVRLPAHVEQRLEVLPVGEGTYWGPAWHRNFCAVLSEYPPVEGPEKASLHELVPGGVDGLAGFEPAGDGYHAWVDVRKVLERSDLMAGCRVPLRHFLEKLHGVTPPLGGAPREAPPPSASSGPPRGGAVAPTGILAGHPSEQVGRGGLQSLPAGVSMAGPPPSLPYPRMRGSILAAHSARKAERFGGPVFVRGEDEVLGAAIEDCLVVGEAAEAVKRARLG